MSIWMTIALLGVLGTILWLLFGITLHGLAAMLGDAQGRAVARNVGPGPEQASKPSA